MRQVLPFILCGGAGTRLWPLSREAYPKQFHRLTGPESLFQLTCRRLSGPLFGEISILSNQRYRFLIAEQLEEIGTRAGSIILEPTLSGNDLGEIVGWMASQGVPQQLALSPVGLKIAWLLRNDAMRQSGRSASPAPNSAAESVAASLLQGRPEQDPVNGPSRGTTQPGQPMTREQQIKSVREQAERCRAILARLANPEEALLGAPGR
jgi:hypothetical protein